MRSLLVLVLLFLAVPLLAEPIQVELSVDPVGVRNRTIRCSVINNSKRLVKGWDGYDGKRNVLISRLDFPISMRPVYEMEQEQAWVKPGERCVLFEIFLEDALLLNRPTNGGFDYSWGWYGSPPRGAAPMSPIHPMRGAKWESSRLDSGALTAQVTIDGKVYTSPEVPFSLKKK